MDSKQHDSDKEDNSEPQSPHEIKPFKSWNEVGQKFNSDSFGNNYSRKRKIVTESEMSENGDLASESTMLIPKREHNSSLGADNQSPELYGLKQKFLESLGIKPPLAKWVYVVNFRCDKVELKEVFELAGHIVSCSVVSIRERYANIQYSHPLEAVQAISMFNGQILYGMKLKVSMINPPSDTIILPKGLKDIGPGLGFNGRPLRDIVKHYKKYTKHQRSLVDASLFCRNNDEDDDDKELDSKTTDSKTSGENSDVSNRKKYFKITNVEDLPVKESSQDSSVSENQSKRARLIEPDDSSSDEERVDPRIVSNLPAKKKDNETPEKETSKDPRIGGSSIQTIGGKPRSASAANSNPRPQNVQPPISQPGFQFGPNQSMGNAGPVPMGPSMPMGPIRPMGPAGQVTPFRPPGPGIPPAGPNPPMMAPIGYNGPMMRPVGPTGPPLRPNGPMGPFGPPTGPVGPPAGMMGPSGPYVPLRPPGPNVPIQGPNPGVGPHPMIHGAAPNPSGSNQPMPSDVITLQFRNLPPSTTFPLLCDKVSQCGQVLSLQLTTPGCAVARFAHRAHAERCFQFFNGKCIDGCIIEVRFA